VSTRLTQESRDALLAGLATDLGLGPTDYLFLLHHGSVPVRVEGRGVDLVSGAVGSIALEPGDVAVIREDSAEWRITAAGA
jgi:beta-galactosidase